MKALILSVGTELLLGDTLNTNARYLAEQMAQLGINVYKQITIGDNSKRLYQVLQEELLVHDLILVTGGLGPTADDITKETCAAVLGQELILNEESYLRLKSYFSEEYALVKNQKQSMFPPNAVILPNHYGTADGCIMIKDSQHIVLLPGPPNEMKAMFEGSLLPILQMERDQLLFSRNYSIGGMGEWQMEQLVSDLIANQTNPTIAPYAKADRLVLKLTARAKDEGEALAMFAPYEDLLQERFGENFLGHDERSLEEQIGFHLVESQLRVSCAESITGGMIAAKLINYPGISEVLKESYIVYSDEAKRDLLGVSAQLLKEHSAVSEQVLSEMLDGLKKRTGADVCLATTGYAGPGGEEVGLVYYGCIYRNEREIISRKFKGDRNTIRKRVTREALNLLMKHIRRHQRSLAE
ncbi:MAG: competence/damage-inducible protein A [Tissierellia bacterium]|nr:competence/damage-inducible protein A [Tissierellia bacterium]